MSWQAGQHAGGYGGKGAAHLGAMQAAVFQASLAASQKALVEEGLRQIHQLLAKVPDDIHWPKFQLGMQTYLSAPRAPRLEYPALATVGRVTLRDAGGSGSPVVLVPSMVNRGYILDLLPGFSLVEALRDAGHRVLIIDWGEPGSQIFTMEQIVADHLVPLLQQAAKDGPVGLVGYCMGGLLGLAGSVLVGPQVVSRVALLATPWDFSVTASSGHMITARPVMEPWLNSQKVIPPEVMQQYFWLLDPWSPVRRLMAYANATGAEQTYLTALEDWLNDGLALDGPIGQEILMGWFADNRAHKGEWHIRGHKISPSQLKVPLWTAVGQRDTLVPPPSAMPLIAQSNGAQVVMVDAGHVGLVAGRSAPTKIYKPLAEWFKIVS